MTDTKFDAIKTRFDAWDIASECNDATKQCHIDRATLIALVESERARADKAEAARRVKEIESVAVDVAASLAAAISLLERGGKKAAPSDKMFEQMLTDYRNSLERARTALKETDND